MSIDVTNKLTIIGTDKQVEEVMDFIKIEKVKNNQDVSGIGTIDFNKITPMPRWVYGCSSEVEGVSLKDEEKYGPHNTISIWSRKNWGTKFNAFSQPDKRNTANTIYFKTTNSGIPSLISKLAWIFPDVIIEYSWASDNYGYDVAKIKFKNTRTLEEYLPIGGTKEAFDLANEITKYTE